LFIFSKKLSTWIYNDKNVAKYIKILAPLCIFVLLDSVIDNILKGHIAIVSCAIQLSNTNIVSCSCDYQIKIWNLEKYSCIYTIVNDDLNIPREYIKIINLPKLCFATCDTNGEIKFFKCICKKNDSINCKEIQKISDLNNSRITSLLYLEKNKIVTSIYDNNSIIFWTINPPQKQCIFDNIPIYSSNSIAKYDNNIIVIVSENFIYIIDDLIYQIILKSKLVEEYISTIFIRKNKNILFSTTDSLYEYEYDNKNKEIIEKGKYIIGTSPYIFSAMGENENGDIIIIDSYNSFIFQ
jgi:WD40 repeat protein